MQRKLFEQGSMSMRQETALGVAMLVAGLVIAGVAVSRMGPERIEQAQVTPPPAPAKRASDDKNPVQSLPEETRPTTPAPEPARPRNNESGTTGMAPPSPTTGDRPPVTGTPLPKAPAEKVAPSVQGK